MIKEYFNDTLEIDNFLKDDLLLKKDFIQKRSEFVYKDAFTNTKSLIGRIIGKKPKLNTTEDFSSLERIRIVVDSLVEDASVDAICEKERISKETYLSWKKDFFEAFNHYSEELLTREKIASSNKKLILKEASQEVYDFFKKYVSRIGEGKNLVIPKQERLTSYSNFYKIQNVFILNKMNDFRMINKHLEEVNQKLPYEGVLVGCFETFRSRNAKKKVYRIPVIKHFYSALQFVFMRVVPKLPLLKKIYFYVTKGKGRLLSKAEALGRLVCCGFDIIDYKQIDGIHYFAAKKIKEPAYDMNPSYGPLFKMRRVGKNGKIIGVYKFRTMHPYSEYLQDYILKLNGYGENGKPANDFRLVPWGKFLRKYWLDELPQLINLFKGELKLVGSRPVSLTYFKQIPKDIQELRLKQKPGCVPPYVALNRNSSVESVLSAEKEYLLEKNKNPYYTDTKYFFNALFNIVFGGKRSA